MFCLELAVLLHRALEARVEALMQLLTGPGWQEDPDRLHDVRVASRRLRAVLDLVEPDIYPGHRRHARRLRRLTRALGRTRELDVHLGIVEDLARRVPDLDGGPALEHLLEVVGRRQRRARRAMAATLEGLCLKRLPRLLQVPSLPDPFRAGDLPPAVWSCLEPWLDGAFPPPDLLDRDEPAALHALRIRVKRLRYALEVLGVGFQSFPETQLRQLRALQTALGYHHDLATLEAFLARHRRGLEERGRVHLAAGAASLLVHLGEERQIAFEQYRALAVGTDRGAFLAVLRQDLGLAEAGAGAP
jgi:CHAD domain-containing protein